MITRATSRPHEFRRAENEGHFWKSMYDKRAALRGLQNWNTVKARFTDTRLIRTPHYYEQFALSPRKESLHIFSKFNPLTASSTDTSLIQTLSMASSVSLLTGFDCTCRLLFSPLTLSVRRGRRGPGDENATTYGDKDSCCKSKGGGYNVCLSATIQH